MKFKIASIAIALIAAFGFITAANAHCGACGAGHSHAADKADMKSMNIVETAISAGSFNTLVAAVKAAGLAETLMGEGPFTVFAPTDAAFAKLPEGTVDSLLKPENIARLKAILTYHVVPGEVTASDAMKISSAATVQGQRLAIKSSGGKVMIDNALVTQADILASNGVIHVIDTVILPTK